MNWEDIKSFLRMRRFRKEPDSDQLGEEASVAFDFNVEIERISQLNEHQQVSFLYRLVQRLPRRVAVQLSKYLYKRLGRDYHFVRRQKHDSTPAKAAGVARSTGQSKLVQPDTGDNYQRTDRPVSKERTPMAGKSTARKSQ